MTGIEKGLITVLACAAVFVALAVPLILGRVPPNRIYGYRTRATLSDERIWYKANAYFAWTFLIGSVVTAVVALMLFEWGGLSPRAFRDATIVLLLAPVAVAGPLTSRYMRELGPREG